MGRKTTAKTGRASKSRAEMNLRTVEAPAKRAERSGRSQRDQLPATLRLFPSQDLDANKLENELEQLFENLSGLRERNPFGNSVKLLALEIGKKLDSGA